MKLNLKTPNFEDEKPSRFALVNDADMKRFQEANQSAATKKNTRWGRFFKVVEKAQYI